ncbi:MAG: hypothetical protein HeimC2_21820 [Candidatus Heimdallarchaeota archaeon LC_2]|nr:MAG: hypothetical protein HeimC2_21820 [Candidatus Heimdallarchaeota archaeon LC_2]
MKVILSRKGFDTYNGGYASPILPDDTLMSLPIPSDRDKIQYSDLKFDNDHSYFERMKEIDPRRKSNKKYISFNERTKCHLDPDIYRYVKLRRKGWMPLFGPSGKAYTELTKEGVSVGDLFLFYGWFKRTIEKDGILEFAPKAQDLHVIFGYLQVGEIYQVANRLSDNPTWMRYHPHVENIDRRKNRSIVYVASKFVMWDDDITGSGVFSCNENVILTKKGYPRSRWLLPEFFRKVRIYPHTSSAWREEGYFQSTSPGQEFVIEDNDKVENWAKSLINRNDQSEPESNSKEI